MTNMAYFLAELSLLEYDIVISNGPSKIAAAAVFAARFTLGRRPFWTQTLQHNTKFSQEQIKWASIRKFIRKHWFVEIMSNENIVWCFPCLYCLELKFCCRECAEMMVCLHTLAKDEDSILKVVYNKFSVRERHFVALLPPGRGLLLLENVKWT